MHTVYALKHVYVPARNFGSNLESAVTFCAICVVFDLSCEKYVWFPNQSVLFCLVENGEKINSKQKNN